MPSRQAVIDMIENQQIPTKRKSDFVSTTAALSLTYNAHADKIIRSTGTTAYSITLPLATAGKSGETYTIMNGAIRTDTVHLTIETTSNDVVYGTSTAVTAKGIKSPGSTGYIGTSVTVVSDGSGYYMTAVVGGGWIPEA